MPDGTVAAPAPVETPAVEAAPEAVEPAAFVDPVDDAFGRLAAEAATELEGEAGAEPAGDPEPKTEPEAKPPGEAKPAADLGADEALFSDKALGTAQGVKAAAARVRELRATVQQGLQKVEKEQRKVDRDFLVLKKREKSFTQTKAEHLEWHAGQRSEARMLGGHVQALRTGTPGQVLESLGFLMGKDGRTAFEELVQGGAAMRKQANPEVEAVRAELAEIRAERQRERDGARLAAERQHKVETVQRREGEVLALAKDAGTYPTLAQYVAERPNEVLDEVVALKDAHRRTYGVPLADADAILQLDQSLARLLGSRGGAGDPRPSGNGSDPNPGGQSGQSIPAKQPSRVAGIPPSASTQVPVSREPTEEERRQDWTEDELKSMGLW